MARIEWKEAEPLYYPFPSATSKKCKRVLVVFFLHPQLTTFPLGNHGVAETTCLNKGMSVLHLG